MFGPRSQERENVYRMTTILIQCGKNGSTKRTASVIEQLRVAESETARFDRQVLSLALNYGGRQEITRAARLLIADAMNGQCRAGELTTELFSRYLYGADLPDPDLVIRTGGEIRVSNFSALADRLCGALFHRGLMA